MENYFWTTENVETKEKLYVLIIYDVVDNRRRVKLAKMLDGYGFRVQKSAFEALISDRLYRKLLSELPKMIDKSEDSIRVYRFHGYGEVKLLGVNEKLKNEDVIII